MENKINMYKSIIFILIVSLFICFGCFFNKSTKNNEQIKSLSISALFKKAYKLKDDSSSFNIVSKSIIDSLQQKNIVFAIRKIGDINYDESFISWSFIDCTDRLPHFAENLVFEVTLKDDAFFYNGREIKVHDIGRCYNKRVLDFYSKDDKIETTLPFKAFLLSVDYYKNLDFKDELINTFNCFDEFLTLCDKRKDTLSIIKYNRSYDRLNFEEKLVIEDLKNYELFIVFKIV